MKSIEVFSTFALDKFIENGVVFKESRGGPAHFISQTLTELKIPHVVYSPDEVVVEILFTDKGEFGKVPTSPQKAMITHKDGAFLIVSTLLDDWNITEGKSPLYIDVQGYVRDGSDFGKKRVWKIPEQLWQLIVCVKGTEEEVLYLDKAFVEDQKNNRQLIITKGALGVDIFVRGKYFFVPAVTINNLPDTVGAGDTWFAAYTAQQVVDKTPQESAEFATRYVAEFLRKKIK